MMVLLLFSLGSRTDKEDRADPSHGGTLWGGARILETSHYPSPQVTPHPYRLPPQAVRPAASSGEPAKQWLPAAAPLLCAVPGGEGTPTAISSTATTRPCGSLGTDRPQDA
jgi:hypothetical protein